MSPSLKKIYVKVALRENVHKDRRPAIFLYRFLLLLGNLVRAAVMKGPGVGFHTAIAGYALRWIGSGLSRPLVYGLLVSPMDTFRYFEFDFFWKVVTEQGSLGAYLDVSSPRMFSWRVIASGRTSRAVILNPDTKDLAVTKQLFNAARIGERCEFKGDLIEDLKELPESFDTVTCISVLEHIPCDASIMALQTMWKLVKPGGRLLLSVPCAAQAFEEFINFNEYGLLHTTSDGYVFGQRFYDEQLVAKLIFSVVGKPLRMAVFGEKKEGSFVLDRARKFSDADYPFWREPWMMTTQYQYFQRIESMPGLGVVAFEFVKK